MKFLGFWIIEFVLLYVLGMFVLLKLLILWLVYIFLCLSIHNNNRQKKTNKKYKCIFWTITKFLNMKWISIVLLQLIFVKFLDHLILLFDSTIRFQELLSIWVKFTLFITLAIIHLISLLIFTYTCRNIAFKID